MRAPLVGPAMASLAAAALLSADPCTQDQPQAAVAAEQYVKHLELDAQRPDAMQALWQLGSDAVPALTRAIRDPRLEVVRSACAVLRELGPAAVAARPHLERRLEDADAKTAAALRWALHGITTELTVLALWSGNKVVFLDAKGVAVREIAGLTNPWGVHALPEGHVLVGAASGSKVCEYDTEDEVVWTFKGKVGQALRVQRLYDGNTLITDSQARIIEVDAHSKIVWEHAVTASWARRLLNGHTLFIDTKSNKLVELDRSGESVKEFEVPQGVYGAWPLPSGNLLLAVRTGKHQLLEIGAKGETVRATETINSPNDCLRLPDGTTIVAGQRKAAAFDAKGKELWSFESEWVGGVSR